VARKTTHRDRDILKRFVERYGEWKSDVASVVEREVIGVSVGLNGYTTPKQADALIRRLKLRSSMRVLDLGAGNGWPGVHFAAATGCQVVLADIPKPALRSAVARAKRRRVARRCAAVLASAVALPFRPAAFDAIAHTDVMC
jgi:SAM-dependent methyltransferase